MYSSEYKKREFEPEAGMVACTNIGAKSAKFDVFCVCLLEGVGMGRRGAPQLAAAKCGAVGSTIAP